MRGDSSTGEGSCCSLGPFPSEKPYTHSWWPQEAWLECQNLEGGKRRHAMWPSSASQSRVSGRQPSPGTDSLQMCLPVKCFTKKPDNLVVNLKHPLLSSL